jgi:hypothetical protein
MESADPPVSPILFPNNDNNIKKQELNSFKPSTAESTPSRSIKSSSRSSSARSTGPGAVDNADAHESVLHSPAEPYDEDFASFQPQKTTETQRVTESRSEEYRQLFHLPREEVLVRDFNCALQKNILLQGHMYLFLRYVCFYSNIFGYEKKKIIPLRDITCVQKAKTAGIFPNAIEIVAWGKKHFFGSFLSRDEAYRLIEDGWLQHSEHEKLLLDSQDNIINTSSSEPKTVSCEETQIPQRKAFPDMKFVGRDAEEAPQETEEPDNEATNQDGVCNLAEELASESSESTVEEERSTLPYTSWLVEDEDAPQLPEEYKMVVESKFTIDVEEFFRVFFSDDATEFLAEFHRKCGDEDFRCTAWNKDRHFGHVRDVLFRHPIKFYFGSKSTHCQEAQRFRVYRNSHLVVETSQQMNDIPYGDYFRVEGRWDVEKVSNGGNSECVLRIFVNVAFSRKTFWKGKIEQGTFEECREAYTTWIHDANALLKQMDNHNIKAIDGMPSFTTVPENGLSPQTLKLVEHGEEILIVEEKEAQIDCAITEADNRGQHTTDRQLLARNSERELPQESSVISENVKSQSTGETLLTKPSEKDSSPSPLLPHVYSSLSLHWKSASQLSLILVLIFAVILVVSQITIIRMLARHPMVQYSEDRRQSLQDSNDVEMSARLDQRIYFLKEEMSMIEARLKSIHHDFTLLKMHLQELDQLNSKNQQNVQTLP